MTNILTYSMPPQQKPTRQLRTNTRKYARLEKWKNVLDSMLEKSTFSMNHKF